MEYNPMKIVVLIFALILCEPAAAQENKPLPTEASRLTNKDILDMQAFGLSGETIAEKIKISVCVFDTSPGVLAQLKLAGVPEPVILAMLRYQPPAAMRLQVTPDAVNSGNVAKTYPDIAPKGYIVSYVKSDRKWKLGVRSEPYNKISEYFEKCLTKSLAQQGINQIPVLDSGCCRVTLELLMVTSHPAVIKKPGIDVTANVSLTDASNRLVYSKGYRGESRTALNTWGHLINHAVEAVVENILADENLIKVLGTGKL